CEPEKVEKRIPIGQLCGSDGEGSLEAMHVLAHGTRILESIREEPPELRPGGLCRSAQVGEEVVASLNPIARRTMTRRHRPAVDRRHADGASSCVTIGRRAQHALAFCG